jgi:hypothetical protein
LSSRLRQQTELPQSNARALRFLRYVAPLPLTSLLPAHRPDPFNASTAVAALRRTPKESIAGP